jgi:hypothetical protein
MINKQGKIWAQNPHQHNLSHSKIMGMNKGALFLRVYSAARKMNSVASLIPMSQ